MRRDIRAYALITVCVISTALECGWCEGFKYQSQGKRDPFVPLITVGTAARSTSLTLEEVRSIDDVKLEGIAVGQDGHPIVILNGELMKEADTKGSVSIKKISRTAVTLSISGEEHTLKFFEEEGGQKGGK